MLLSLKTYHIHLSSIAVMIASHTITILDRGSTQKLKSCGTVLTA
jgi:hypothetical protein